MKRIARKLTLVLLLLLSVALMLVGVCSIAPASASAEGEPIGAQQEPTHVEGSWYRIDYSEDGLSVLVSASYRSYLETNRSELNRFVDTLKAAVKEIFVQNILQTGTPSAAALDLSSEADDVFSGTENLEKFRSYITERLSKPEEFEKFLQGDYDLLVDYAIGSYVSSRDLSAEGEEEVYGKIRDAMKEVVDEAAANVVDEQIRRGELSEAEREQALAEKKAGSDKKVEARVEAVQANGGAAPSVDLNDLLAAFQFLSVNGNVVYNKAGGDSNGFDFDGLRYLLTLIPRPSEIAEMDEAQLAKLLSAHIEIGSTYGEVGFEVSFGFYGNAELITGTARYLADHFDLAYSEGQITAYVRVPALFSKAMGKMMESDRFTANQKDLVFSLFGLELDGLYNKFTGYTFDQILNFLKGIDYQYWFSNFANAEFLNAYFGDYIKAVTGKELTQQQIYDFVDELHDFFAPKAEKLGSMTAEEIEDWLERNLPFSLTDEGLEAAQKFLDYLKKIDWAKFDSQYVKELLDDPSSKNINGNILDLLDKFSSFEDTYRSFLNDVAEFYGYIPDRFKDGSVAGLYDGEKFVYDGGFNVISILDRASAKLEANKINDIATFLSTLAQALEEQGKSEVGLYFEVSVPDFYKVEYTVDGEVVREGFLPSGVSAETLSLLSGHAEIEGFEVLYWYDANGAPEPATMPAANVTLAPVTAFTVTAAEDVEKVYDRAAETLSVTVEGVPYATYTYQWYKDGKPIGESETLSVCTVADSGVYTVDVTDTGTGYTVRSAEMTVAISPVEITAEAVFTGGDAVYSAAVQTVDWTVTLGGGLVEKGYTLEELLTVTKDGDLSATDAGSYQATLTVVLNEDLEDKENFLFAGIFEEKAWKIEQATVSVKWFDTTKKPVVYNGELQALPHENVFEATVDSNAPVPEFVATEGGQFTGTDAAEYHASLTLALKEADQKNYRFAEGTELTHSFSWEIVAAEVSVDSDGIKYAKETTYDKSEQTNAVSYPDLFAGILMTVEGNKRTNAGDYTITVRFELKEDYQNNYRLVKADGSEGDLADGVLTVTLSWKIQKAEVPAENLPQGWKNSKYSFESDGQSHKIVYDGEGAYEDFFDVAYTYEGTDETVTEIGVYTVTAEFTLKEEIARNYVLAEGKTKLTFQATVEITFPAAYILDMTGVAWRVNGAELGSPYTYNGSAFTVSLFFPENSTLTAENKALLASWIKITSNGKAAEIKNAGTYSVKFEPASEYRLNNNDLSDIEIVVKEAEIAATVAVQTASQQYTGDALTFAFTVTSDDAEKFDVDPASKSFTETEVGKYTKTVTLTLKSEFVGNYVFKGGKNTLEFTVEFEITAKPKWPAGSKFGSEDGNVSVTDVDGVLPQDYTAAFEKQEALDEQQLEAIEEKIKELYPDERYDFTVGSIYDIHFNDASGAEQKVNGKFKVSLKIPDELLKYPDDRLLVIHITDSGIEVMDGASRNGDYMEFETDGFSVYAVIGLEPIEEDWLLIGALCAVAGLLLVVLILLCVYASKVKKDRKAAEEAAEERAAAEAEEAAKAEEEAAKEEEETSAAEEAEEEKAPAFSDPNGPYPAPFGGIAYPPEDTDEEEEEEMTIYDRSFTARLAQAEAPLPAYYSELKNYLLSYKYVRSRVSWSYDSFNKGRRKLCKLQIRGKSLYLYIALDPDSIDPKYHHKDVSAVDRFKDVPTKLKVRSERSLKYAKELVDILMKAFDIEQGEIESVDYTIPYKSTEELIEVGEIREKGIASEEFWKMDADDVIDNAPALPEADVSDLSDED